MITKNIKKRTGKHDSKSQKEQERYGTENVKKQKHTLEDKSAVKHKTSLARLKTTKKPTLHYN